MPFYLIFSRRLIMKKRTLFLSGIIIMIIAALVFMACPTDSGDGDSGFKIDPPKVGDLPGLPSDGSAPATDQTQALSLLNSLSGVAGDIRNDIGDLIDDETTVSISGDSETWSFKDKLVNGVKVSSSGSGSFSYNGEDYDHLKVGESIKYTSNVDTSAVLTVDKAGFSTTIVSGSTIAEKNNFNQNVTITKINSGTGNPSEYNGSFSVNYAYSYGITATNGTVAARIIFSATATQSFSGTASADLELPWTISGSLKVYGADDTNAVYTETIANENDLDQALQYFSNYDFH
jgi:hypothetical protein